jgi:Ca2+-binding RTX toxin-like protein
MNSEVFMSLLALDAYNRGDAPGVNLNGSEIGRARVLAPSSFGVTAEQLALWQSSGFSATAYELGGAKIISYRGTNFDFDTSSLSALYLSPGARDITQGWTVGAGFAIGTQPQLAIEFYEQVTGIPSIYDTNGGTTTLVGHSLGGGLAGFVGALGLVHTYAFDHMPFLQAAAAQATSVALARALDVARLQFGADLVLSSLVAPAIAGPGSAFYDALVAFTDAFVDQWNTIQPQADTVHGIFVEGELVVPIRDIDSAVNGIDASLLNPLLLYLRSVQIARGIQGNFSEDVVAKRPIDNRGIDFGDPISNLVGLHSISLLSILQFGEKQWSDEGGRTGWQNSAKYVFDKVSDDGIGTALGLKEGETGGAAEGDQLSSIIAYSAINEGTRLFGDTGIRALFNDADDLGDALAELPDLVDERVRSNIGKLVAEFAGLLAFSKIEQTQWDEATDGILSLGSDGSTLNVDLTDTTWSLNGLLPAAHNISSAAELRRSIIDAALDRSALNQNQLDFVVNQLNAWTETFAEFDLNGIDSISFALQASGAFAFGGTIPLIVFSDDNENYVLGNEGDPEANARAGRGIILAGDGVNFITVTGGVVREAGPALIGGGGTDTLTGSVRNEFFYGGRGDNVIDGGNGFDTAIFVDSGTAILKYTGTTQLGSFSISGNGFKDTVSNIEHIVIDAATPIFRLRGNIANGTNVLISSQSDRQVTGGQAISAQEARAGQGIFLNQDGRRSQIIDDDTDGIISFANFNTTIFASDFDDTIFDGSDEEKIIFGGTGNDTISIAETLPGSILIGGDGTDRFIGGHGSDVIIDQQASATSISVLLRPDIIEPDPYFRSLVGSVDAGYGDDDIVVEIGGIAGSHFDGFVGTFGAGVYIDELPSGGDPSLEYDINAGKGNDRVQINFLGRVNYKYQRGDGGDFVNLTNSGTFGSSDLHYVLPAFSIEQTSLAFDFSDYSRDEVTIRFGEVSSQVLQRDGPNFDIPTRYLTRGDLLIEFSDGGSIFVEDLIGVTASDFKFRLGAEPEDPDVVFLDAAFTFRDGGEFVSVFLERSPLSPPAPPSSPAPPPPEPSNEGEGDESGETGPDQPPNAPSVPEPPSASGDGSSVEPASTAQSFSISGDGGGIAALNAVTGDEPLEVRLQRGNFAYAGSTATDRLFIEWTLDSLAVSLTGDSLTVSDRWGVLGTTTLTDFDEVYVFEADETYTIQGFVDALAARQFAAPVEGAEADDALIGTAIRDRIFGYEGNDTIEGLAGNDIISAGEGNDVASGGDGDDVLMGEAGNDILVGGAGDDHLDGGLGDDTLTGGSGDDTYIVDGLSDIVVELADEGIDRVVSSVDHVLSAHIEELSLVDQALGGVGNDLDNAIKGNDANNDLSGLGGNDILLGGDGSDTLDGGEGDDLLRGQSGEDVLIGGNDNDTLIGGEGADTIDGGEGFDTAVFVGFSDDYEITFNFDGAIEVLSLAGDDGFDILTNVEALRFSADGATILASELPALGTAGDDNITGGSRGDRIFGLDGNDTLTGLGGNDFLDGGGDADVLVGGAGDDRYIVDNPNDLVVELADEGYDYVEASLTYVLGDNVEGLVLGSDTPTDGTGNSLDNQIHGDDQNNVLRGLGGDDHLAGSGGDDFLFGGDGDDTLSGGEGTDDIDGGQGFDTAEYRGDISNYQIFRRADGRVLVIDLISQGATDTLLNVERLRFSNFPAVGDVVVDVADLPIAPTNSAPVVVTQALGQSVAEDEQFSIAIDVANFVDVDGDLLTLSVSLSDGTPLPAWLTFDGTRLVGLPPRDFNGVLDLAVAATDGALTATAPFQLTIDPVNDTPVLLQPLADQAATGGGQVAFTIPASAFTDPDGDTLSYTAELTDGSALPQWLAFNAASRAFSGTAQNAGAAFNIRVVASDGTARVEDVFLLTVGLNLTGTSAAETLTGGEGNDTITGLGGNDTLIGTGGDDVFRVTGTAHGFDSIDGGTGTDTIVATSNGTIIGLTAINGIEQINGGSFSNVSITGSSNADILNFSAVTLTAITRIDGGAGNDTITGSAAADTIHGSGGNDTIDSGDGDDIIQFISTTGGFDAINGGAGTDTITALSNSAVIGLSSLANVEAIDAGAFTNVVISGTANDDTLNFAGVTLTAITRIDGGAGNDTITGSAAADTIRGSTGDDTIDAGDGNDTIQFTGTGGGFDAINGGAGTDTISALSNSAVIGLLSLANVEAISAGTFTGVYVAGSGGDNILDFSSVTLTNITRVQGGDGNDTLIGNSAANTLWGGIGNDIIDGGAGNDILLGENGDDTIKGAEGADTINGGNGTDTVDYSAYFNDVAVDLSLTSAQTVATGDFDTITNVENVVGGLGNDTLSGSTSNNVLSGGAGNDRLTGRAGNDVLMGGMGTSDTAVFAGLQASYSVVTNSGVVTVVDNQTTTDGNDGTDTIIGIERLEFKGGAQVGIASPIILDLDGNGIETVSAASSDARFDLDGDGLADDTSWIGAGDAFLYLDRDANGTVSGVEEISFIDDVPDAATDLAGLRAFDSNSDGILDARDGRFADFGVWRDADGDGAVDEGETASLATVGIRSVNLTGTPVDAVTEFGEVAIANTGSFTLTNGTTRTFADAALTYFSAATNLPSLG